MEELHVPRKYMLNWNIDDSTTNPEKQRIRSSENKNIFLL